jgi:hypothetical protein
MAVKKQSATPRKSTRSAKTKNPAEATEHIAIPDAVSTSEPTSTTARNAVIEGNSAIDLDNVRRRAYELYEERGRAEGLHEDDWYRAEQELRTRNTDPNPITPRKKSA